RLWSAGKRRLPGTEASLHQQDAHRIPEQREGQQQWFPEETEGRESGKGGNHHIPLGHRWQGTPETRGRRVDGLEQGAPPCPLIDTSLAPTRHPCTALAIQASSP